MGAGKQWVTVWLEEMDETIGGVFEIKDTDASFGYMLDLNSGRWYYFPESALELVEETLGKILIGDMIPTCNMERTGLGFTSWKSERLYEADHERQC